MTALRLLDVALAAALVELVVLAALRLRTGRGVAFGELPFVGAGVALLVAGRYAVLGSVAGTGLSLALAGALQTAWLVRRWR